MITQSLMHSNNAEFTILTQYDKKGLFRENCTALLIDIKTVCKINNIPFIFAAALENIETSGPGKTRDKSPDRFDTMYEIDGCLTGSMEDMKLCTDIFPPAVAALRGLDLEINQNDDLKGKSCEITDDRIIHYTTSLRPDDYTEFDKTEAFEKCRESFNKLISLCREYNIPFLFAAAIKNSIESSDDKYICQTVYNVVRSYPGAEVDVRLARNIFPNLELALQGGRFKSPDEDDGFDEIVDAYADEIGFLMDADE